MAVDEQIDLAKTEGFGLGPLRISPPILEVASGDTRETLEPRIMQVLVALARRRGEVVSRDDLIAQCWDGRSVGDDAINRCIARLRRLAEAEGGFVIETIPRVGYRLVERADAEIPPTPETATDGVDPLAPSAPWWRSGWMVVAALVLIVAATGAALWLAPPVPLTRVAVLPLQPLGRGEELRVFSAAVAEQTVGVLNENQVQAVARADIANLRGPGRDEAAQKLGADFILDGTVESTPYGLRVIVHLDRASSHATLWSGTFDQAHIDPTSLESEVAARVVDEITGALQASVLHDDAAVAAFLKAKEFSREPGRTAAALRRDQLHIVVAHAPDFSPGHSGLAWSSALLVQYAEPADAAALREEARREAQRALALNPNNGEAWLALAALAPPRDYAEQERLFREGLKVQPDEPTLNSSLAALLQDVGRNEEALPLHERAAMLDRLSPRKNAAYADALAVAGDLAQARAIIERAARRWPDNTNVWAVRLYIESFHDLSKARALAHEGPRIAPTLEPDLFAALNATIEALNHDTPETRAAARDALMAAVASRHFDDDGAIEWLVRLGEIDAAYAVSNLAFFSGEPTDHFARPDTAVLMRPTTVAMRRDKRFAALVDRLGLTAYWKEHTAPDFCRSETEAPCPDLKRGGR